ncbi:MAG: hypothetical protein WBW88_07595 [Rhodothermales bacterium]
MCGESSATYSIRQVSNVIHRLVVYSGNYVRVDTTQVDTVFQMTEYPDGTIEPDALSPKLFDLEQRYRASSSDSLVVISTYLRYSSQTRKQTYKKDIGLIDSSVYPAPFLGAISSSQMRLESYSRPDPE